MTNTSPLSPLETLLDRETGLDLPLPEEIRGLYGRLQLPPDGDHTYLIGNFVETLDGVISLNEPGFMSPGEISGDDPHDHMVMGLLRAASDVVIAGASAVRSPPGHIWTPDYIYPPLAQAYRQLRANLGKPEYPLNVVVTGQGSLDLSLPLFQSGAVPVLVLTTEAGARRLSSEHIPLAETVRIVALQPSGRLSAPAILAAVAQAAPSGLVLMEGGPHLFGEFLFENLMDELFLTVAPQIAGRDPLFSRPGLVSGKRFAPGDPRWGKLSGVKRSGDYLFLRYSFKPG